MSRSSAQVRVRKAWELNENQLSPEVAWWSRRRLLGALSLGTATLAALPGCGMAKERGGAGPGIQPPIPTDVLAKFPAARNPNYDPGRPLSPEEIATRYNNFYELTTRKERVWTMADVYPKRPWTLEVTGLCRNGKTWDVDELLRAFPQEERHYRFRCVEAWSATLPWTGFPLAALVQAADPLPEAHYIRFVSLNAVETLPGQASQPWYPWPYHEGLSLPEAMNELSLMVTGVYGKILPGQHGAPLRFLTPWKYGYKQAKALVRIEFVAEQPKTLWNEVAPDEYDFFGTVDPGVPHPRWSQAEERLIDDGRKIPTQKFNGYGDFVAALYPEGDRKRWGFG
jgi:sulfoxide reductase catalytic subunit YedY